MNMEKESRKNDKKDIETGREITRTIYTTSATIVCSHSVGRGLRAEVFYIMVECSYFAVDGMPIEMYGESWITVLLTRDDIIWIQNDARNLTVLTAHSWHELYGRY